MARQDPLVFLPPMLCDARVFAPQLAELSRDRAVTVAPVHGAERVEEIASSLLDVLPSRFAVAGMGFGGVVALELLRRAEARVTRIALMSCSAMAETPDEAAAREPRLIAAKMGRLPDVIAEELPRTALAETEASSQILSLVRQMGADLGPEAYVRQARAMQRRKDQSATLRNMTRPVLLLTGEADPIVPPKRLEFLSELVVGSALAVIPQAGHLPTLEQPVATTDALREWLGAPLALR